MVDFNNEKTISTPLHEVLKMLILECRYNLLLKIREHYLSKEKFGKEKFAEVKASIMELYYYLMSMFKQGHSDEEAQQLKNRLDSSKRFEDIIEVFEIFEDYMYSKNITKIDNKRQYDQTMLEVENREKGL